VQAPGGGVPGVPEECETDGRVPFVLGVIDHCNDALDSGGRREGTFRAQSVLDVPVVKQGGGPDRHSDGEQRAGWVLARGRRG
jgi:hypothetical protein